VKLKEDVTNFIVEIDKFYDAYQEDGPQVNGIEP
jgi:hypothetical protein